MSNPATGAGLIEVLLERLEKQRLPRLLAIKEKVSFAGSCVPLDRT